MQLFYLADQHDRVRLSTEGTIEAAHDCKPWLFQSADAAYHHPDAGDLLVHAVPAAETLPGVGVGEDFATAADVYRAVASGVVDQVAADVAAIMGAG